MVIEGDVFEFLLFNCLHNSFLLVVDLRFGTVTMGSFMKLNEDQIAKLMQLIHFAFTEIRMLAGQGKSEQAADLADAFHNLPSEIRTDSVVLEQFREMFLKPYQEKYPEGAYNYVGLVDKILASNTDISGN